MDRRWLAAVAAVAVGGALVPAAVAAVRGPVTIAGIGGARVGMSEAAVEEAWGLELRPDDELGLDCAPATFRSGHLEGYAIFQNGKLGSVWLRAGGRTGRGIRTGSTLQQLKDAYPEHLSSRPDKYEAGARNWFFRPNGRSRPGLRFDVSATGRVTTIAYGNRTLELVEACA